VLRSNPEALRRIRETSGHTTPSLAKASGVSFRRIWGLEQESCRMLPTTAKRLADALGVKVTDITVQDDEPAEVSQ
jgi:transcriptional regulator with XRE-family HTH domain